MIRVAFGKTMRCAPGNAQHIGSREEQQDAFGFSDLKDGKLVAHGGLLGVLADGMGGLACGSEASKAAVRAFLSAYQTKTPEESIPEALERALRAANDAVLELARREGLQNQVGTTLVAAVASGDRLHWVSAGDSRLYLWRAGQLTQLTTDHIFASELDAEAARGNLSRDEALNHPGRQDLTSFLGLPELRQVDRTLRPFPVQPGDRVLLCSDGLYRGLGEAEIAAALEDNPNAACERLVERVLAEQLDHQDNVTVMAWQCGSEALASTPRPRVSKRLLLAAASLVAALALGAGWWWWKHRTSEKPQPNGQQTATQPQNNAGAPGEDKAGKNGSGRSGESKTQGGKKQNKKQNKKKQSQSASGNEQQRSAPARGGNEN